MAYILCDDCGRGGFKSKAGLAGHKKIVHGVDTRKTAPDDIGKRLDSLSDNLEVLSMVSFMFMDQFFGLGRKGEVKGETLKRLESVFKDASKKYKEQNNPVLEGLRSAIKHGVK